MRRHIEINQPVLPATAVAPGRIRSVLKKTLFRPGVASVFASLGIFGGISALFIGLVCILIHAIIAGDKVFDRVGTVLLIVAIPTILIGSVFLDEININKC